MHDFPTPPRPTAEHALFLDFDGTLAPIQEDPDTVFLPPGGAALLERLNDTMEGALAVLSGRDIRDLSQRIPLTLWRAGGHGLETVRPGIAAAAEPPPAPFGLMADLLLAIAPFNGVRIEDKGPVAAIHHRLDATETGSGPLLEALDAVAARYPGYKVQSGKRVLEVKPDTAHKGRALARLMEDAPFAGRVPIMVGDDTTDEDAMQVALGLGGWAVKAGEGSTCAPYRLSGPAAVWTWLEEALG